MVHIYCGDGKGKTSAAFGAALRAAGNEMNVLIAQFLKCGTSGELEILRSLDRVSVLVSDRVDKFIWNMNEEERIEVKKENQTMLDEVITQADKFDMIILDEMAATLENHMIDKNMLIQFLEEYGKKCEIIITGRNPAKELIELADYITEMKKIRHPFDKGIAARKGIEY